MTVPVETTKLISMMQSARQRTLELIQGLTQEQQIGPKLPTVNPLIWEIGHIAWFYEIFILRRHLGHAPLLARGDVLYDSIAILHENRWDLPVYPLDEMVDYMTRVFDTLVDHLGVGLADERESYLYQFTIFHEDMHCEAFTSARQIHGYPTPIFAPDRPNSLYLDNTTVHFFSTMKNGRMKYWLSHFIWRARPLLTRRSPTSSPMMDTTDPIYGPRRAGGGAPTSTQRILFTGAAMVAKAGTRDTSIPGGQWHLTRR
jgi:hypothetical protein